MQTVTVLCVQQDLQDNYMKEGNELHGVDQGLNTFSSKLYSVADLEIFRGGFSVTKTPAKLEVKTPNKKVFTSFLSHLF